jgi:hypothetical protein
MRNMPCFSQQGSETDMPIQEILVWNKSALKRPEGVLFDPPCKTKAEDLALWDACHAAHEAEMENGHYIMVVVQTRNVRDWNRQKKQFDFAPAEDYIVASYSIDPSLGVNYDAGTVSRNWLLQQYTVRNPNETPKPRKGLAKLLGKKKAAPGSTVDFTADPRIIPIFRCSDQGCNLTTTGILKMSNMHMQNGQTRAEAYNTASNAITSGQKYGWLGGTFPAIHLGWVGARHH